MSFIHPSLLSVKTSIRSTIIELDLSVRLRTAGNSQSLMQGEEDSCSSQEASEIDPTILRAAITTHLAIFKLVRVISIQIN